MVHFMSILGTSLYEPVIYAKEVNEQAANGKEREYVQLAIMESFRDRLREDGKITIFLTEKARENNWENHVYDKDDADRVGRWVSDRKNEVIAGNKKIGLKEQLEKAFPEIAVKDIDIADAKTEEEIWLVFNQIYNSIEDGDEIIFDITHSFRSIPMLAITIMNYARVMKNCKLGGNILWFLRGGEDCAG